LQPEKKNVTKQIKAKIREPTRDLEEENWEPKTTKRQRRDINSEV
jgi:hypothetical protein